MNAIDQIIVDSVDLAREAAQETAGDFGVGEYLGARVEPGSRQATHFFECPHPGYHGWHWAVTMTRAARARYATVNEVVLLPSQGSLLAPAWVPWADRLEAGDVAPGTLLPTPDNDPRLEPGYTGGELAPDEDPAEWAQSAVACPLPPGGATIHHSRTLHFTGANHSSQPRRAYIMAFGTPTQARSVVRDFYWQTMQKTKWHERAAAAQKKQTM